MSVYSTAAGRLAALKVIAERPGITMTGIADAIPQGNHHHGGNVAAGHLIAQDLLLRRLARIELVDEPYNTKARYYLTDAGETALRRRRA